MEHCEFVLGSSRFLSGLLYFIYLGAALSLFWLDPLPPALKVGGTALILYLLGQKYSLHVKRSRVDAVLTLWQDSKGRWGCQLRNGQCYRGQLLKDSFTSSLLVILRLSTRSRVISIFIPFDALAPQEYRVLCSRLLFFP